MNLILDHNDIITALKDYVVNQGIRVEKKTLDIALSCGRGANTTSATVTLIDEDSLAAGPEKGNIVPITAPTAGKGKKKETSVKQEPVVEEEEVVTPEDLIVNGDTSTGGLFDE